MPPLSLPQLMPDAQAYDRKQKSKAGRESERVGSMPGKNLGHAQQPGSADRPPSANPVLNSW